MSKTSTVSIDVTVVGDGRNDRDFQQAITNNSVAAGPDVITLAAASWTSVAVPTGAKGFVLSPGSAADCFFASFVGSGTGLRFDPTKPFACNIADPSTFDTPNTLVFFSTGGGTINLRWT